MVRWPLYIPLSLSLAGSAVLAIHIMTALGSEFYPAMFWPVGFAAGFLVALRIEKPALLGIVVGSLAAIILHLALLDNWMASDELFRGPSGPPVLLVMLFAGAFLGAHFKPRGTAQARWLSTASAGFLGVLALQAAFGGWPLEFWDAAASVIVAQFVCAISVAHDHDAVRPADLVATIVGTVGGFLVATEAGADPFAIALTVVGATVSMFLMAAAALLIADFADTAAKRADLPRARLRR